MELKPGTKVKLISTGEVGVIIHTWFNYEMDTNDCHIAFYGEEFPDGQPSEPPYILRYLSSSLQTVNE